MKIPTKNIPLSELITQCATYLAHEVDAATAHQYAWWLIEHLTKQSRASLVANQTITLGDEQAGTLSTWLDDIVIHHKPLAYLIGSTPFIDLSILVEPPTLIPRPETEEWVNNLIAHFSPLKNEPLRILDLCTGTGCIALSLAHAFPNASVVGIDIADSALALAYKNATRNNITNVTFVHSNLFAELPHSSTFDLILSNPPYIAHEERKELAPSVTSWEDHQALFADDKGLALIKAIINEAPPWLRTNTRMTQLGLPNLVLEIGHTQGDAVVNLFRQGGFDAATCLHDRAGRARVVSGSMKHVVPHKK